MKCNYEMIHPQLRKAARLSPSITFSSKNLRLVRMFIFLTPKCKTSKDVLIKNIFIPAKDETEKIRLRIYKSGAGKSSAAALLWFHGGGYIMGRPEMDDDICLRYVREAGITVVSVDYPLAPGHPFPAGLEESYSALKWVKTNAEQLGIDAQRIAVGGQSAGGGLAAALAQLACDRREIKPVFQLLVYPMLDDRTVLRTDIDDGSSPAWSQKSNRFGWESYLGKECGSNEVPEYSVPARREDLSGLPAAWIGVGSVDVFFGEDTAYAQRLKMNGVDCELYTVQGAFHGFDILAPRSPVVDGFRKSQIAALQKYLG